MSTTNFSVRMDSDIKKRCEALYGELGVNLTTAINVFLRQSLRVGGFPFDVRIDEPNEITYRAMKSADNDEDMYGPFESVQDLMEALNAED
mgnify:CR=1 FL=1